MADDDTIRINTKGLDQFLKAIKKKFPTIRVGILGDKNARESGKNGNAEIGIRHEFGSGSLPQRSFLRMPLTSNEFRKRLEESGAFGENELKIVVKTGALKDWAIKIGILAEGVVLDAFDSGGFGNWKPSDMRRKKVHQTLVETQQLRNSITSDVKE